MKINRVVVGTAVHGPQKHAETYVREGDPRLGKYEDTFEFPPGTVQEITFSQDGSGSYTHLVKNNSNVVLTENTQIVDDNTIIQTITKGDVTMRITTLIDDDGNINISHERIT